MKRKEFRRVDYRCKLCPKNFGDPRELRIGDIWFNHWLSAIAAHVMVNHPEKTGTVPFNELLSASYS